MVWVPDTCDISLLTLLVMMLLDMLAWCWCCTSCDVVI
jgi:hypothetical protein